MVTPNIWGQGQIFAFSALDGNVQATDDFVGTLSGDKIGIRFHTKTVRELTIINIRHQVPTFETVASDIISFKMQNGSTNIIYADTHLIVGNTVQPANAIILTEGFHTTEKYGNIEIQNTNDGEFTAFLRMNNKFAFAFAHSAEDAKNKVENGIKINIEELKNEKLKLYEKFCLQKDNPYSTLYAKFLSVMKSQLLSPEGNFNKIWSTPDRIPHKHLWLWDSVFHSIGHRNIDTSLAEDLILSIFSSQAENGFIPHLATPTFHSSITQPPVIAWGAYHVYEKSGNKEFLRKVFEANQKFLFWCKENRRDTEDELYIWLTTNDINCRCDESGMDNSPRFDLTTRLQAIDFSCFMANDVRFMAKIAAKLDGFENARLYSEWYEEIKNDINSKLYSKEDGFYYDYDLLNNRLHKVQSIASFLPLFAGICDKEQAKALIGHLTNPETFYTPLPIPSISRKNRTFGTDMWRGPVWINYNYMITESLEGYGYTELADEIRDKTIDAINYWYQKTGTVFEFYDPENISSPSKLNRKGAPFDPYDFNIRYQSIRDLGWSCTLGLDMLHKKYYNDCCKSK